MRKSNCANNNSGSAAKASVVAEYPQNSVFRFSTDLKVPMRVAIDAADENMRVPNSTSLYRPSPSNPYASEHKMLHSVRHQIGDGCSSSGLGGQSSQHPKVRADLDPFASNCNLRQESHIADELSSTVRLSFDQASASKLTQQNRPDQRRTPLLLN